MANIRKWLEDAEKTTGETIEAIVVGQHDARESRFQANDKPLPDENIILSREDGLKKLDQDYDNGYGGADCFPIWAWTANRIYFISEYDGSTRMNYVPRNPIAGEPDFGGNDGVWEDILTKLANR